MSSSTEQNTGNGSDFCEGSEGSNRIIPPDFEWLQAEAPGFSLCGDQIQMLSSPGEYYNAIIKGIKGANERITMTALYIGTGKMEQTMIDVLNDRLETRGKSLEVSILLDEVRGDQDSSVHSILLPLVRKHPHCEVSLFHHSRIRGVRYKVFPSILMELIGVQHIKLYMFDDDIIISGANLAEECFVDREDRFMLISNCPSMADFYHGLIKQICSLSFRLMPDGTLVPRLPHLHPYTSPLDQYETFAGEAIWGFYQKALKDTAKTIKPGDDTWLFPLLQLPPFSITQDSRVTQMIIQSLPADSVAHICTPYFNLEDEYIDSLLHKSKATFNILIPHPSICGWERQWREELSATAGVKALVPTCYYANATKFLQRVDEAEQTARITMGEFLRSSGGYHAKGIWITNKGQDTPHITIIGSSNFNCRSVRRDLECQVVLLTSNQSLRRSLEDERQRIYTHMVPLTLEVANQPNRRLRLWHLVLLWFFKPFM